MPALTKQSKRYHPLLVGLHWLIGILIFAALFVSEGEGGNTSIFSPIGIHMVLGIGVLVLLTIRLLVRWVTQRPEWASTGNKLFDVVGSLTHLGLYVLTFAMTITGILLADHRGMLASAFGIGNASSPARGGFSLGELHGAVWALLIVLIILHLGASLYHQYIVNDNIMARMWFGKKDE